LNIAVIGLGYVGLPLALAFGRHRKTLGFDLSQSKVDAYASGIDPSGESSSADIQAAKFFEPTTDESRLAEADIFIVAVPTPIDEARKPDLSPLIDASQAIGRYMKKGAIVVYESTVYPGVTEEVCIPVLESASEMQWKKDFFVAYSPERINPGDKSHTLANTVKVVAGDTPETLEKVSALYELVVKAGLHKVSSIKAAEAAKVIENTQRDLNIALMNELAVICDKLGIDTLEVLEAAGSKWNFLNFRPGLVGGHCIGVDPYYLTHKAEMLGYHPQVILAGRRINDGMAKYIAEQTVKQMIQAGSSIRNAPVNVLGLTFKENCSDIRNSKVADLIYELQSFGLDVHVHDPVANPEEAMQEYGLQLDSWESLPQANAVVLAVAHTDLVKLSVAQYAEKLTDGGCIIDVKSQLDRNVFASLGYKVWRL
jgi:UDP-N-acetyl-D-glucosamine/UDP-N-acetyl-D-galactosamine dehydrogenase